MSYRIFVVICQDNCLFLLFNFGGHLPEYKTSGLGSFDARIECAVRVD